MKINPYMNFNGNCAEAFQFYQQTLGGEIVAMIRFGDGPVCDEIPESDYEKITHARLIVDGQTLMGSDCAGGHPYEGVKSSWVVLNVDQDAEAEQIYEAFSQGGDVLMPLGETFWASRFGMVTDRYGVPWMINCEKPGVVVK